MCGVLARWRCVPRPVTNIDAKVESRRAGINDDLVTIAPNETRHRREIARLSQQRKDRPRPLADDRVVDWLLAEGPLGKGRT